MWIAVAISEPARWFPRLALSLRQLLFAREFGGCSLTVGLPADHDSSGSTHIAVSPCCQCASMRVRPGTAPRVAKVPVRTSRDSGSPQRELHVPEWVAYSVYPKEEMLESRTQAFAVPRCIRLPSEDRPSRSCRGCLAFARGWRLAVAWFQSFCRIHPMKLCELSANSSASSIDCSTMRKPMMWAALELTIICVP